MAKLTQKEIELIRSYLDDGSYTAVEQKDFNALCDMALRYSWARDRLSIEDVERMAEDVPLGSTNIDEAESVKCDAAINGALAKAKEVKA